MAIHLGWITKQIDFSNAFVQAVLKEEVYINLPPGFTGGDGTRNSVLKLKKSLYGLVQAPRAWYDHLSEAMTKLGYKKSESDPCMFYGNGLIILAYVDDILMFGKNQAALDESLSRFKETKMNFTEETDVFAYLGVEVVRKDDTGEITLVQKGLTDKIVRTTGMEDANQKHTPEEASPLGTNSEGDTMEETWSYPSVIGMLLYLSSNSRPDIQFAVHQCARFSHDPKQSHANAVKRIVRYLIGTKGNGLTFTPDTEMRLHCYVDADFAGLWTYENDQDPVCVKSRTGYVMTLGNCPVTWSSKLQTEIALSTLEAEYIAMSTSMRELIPLRRLLIEISEKLNLEDMKTALVCSHVFEDNNGAIGLAESPKMTPRTKHIAVKYHWFRDQIGEKKGILLKKIESENQKADIFTKGLTMDTFRKIRKLLMGW